MIYKPLLQSNQSQKSQKTCSEEYKSEDPDFVTDIWEKSSKSH